MMSKKWKSVRIRFQKCSLVFFLVILSFGSCYSLKFKGVGFLKCSTKDLWSDRDAEDLTAVGFHRKLLGHYLNPYSNLTRVHNVHVVARVTPPVPSPKRDVSGSSTLSPSLRSFKSSSNGINPILAGFALGALVLLSLVSGVCYFRSKAGKSVNPFRTR